MFQKQVNVHVHVFTVKYLASNKAYLLHDFTGTTLTPPPILPLPEKITLCCWMGYRWIIPGSCERQALTDADLIETD